ncbi:hypothetical protein ILYODFUR_023281 [Ilyodon furcidens]|uniref:Uncharacterized protein n=1 Tax=Ilyodon furcidens TaxID=33524 RepID=A0ABV0SZG9_9TELE
MLQKSKISTLEALKKNLQSSDPEVEDSSDSSVDFEVKEDEKPLLRDPVHDQEEAGQSGTERTQPPTT